MKIVFLLVFSMVTACSGSRFIADQRDIDRDGILDSNDMCPNNPEEFDGFEDEDGCPDPDNDNDGILDIDDQCPMEPETLNEIDDEDGCPDVVPKVKIDGGHPHHGREVVLFEPGSSELSEPASNLLEEVARVLRENPDITLLEVSGHATTEEDKAQTLSELRAQAVVDHLVSLGIEAQRLVLKANGDGMPLTSEPTDAQNRRVEFNILERKE